MLIDVKQVRVLLRLRQAAGGASGGFPDEVLYIYRKQIEEADVLVVNKADLVSPAELTEIQETLAARFPDTPIAAVSALTGEGVDAWLELLDANRLPGGKIVEVDYDVYAAGEAALGWMNARAELRTTAAVDWSDFAHRLLETIRDRVVCSGGQIGHLKLYLSVPGQGHVAGNATANDSPIAIAGSLPPNVPGSVAAAELREPASMPINSGRSWRPRCKRLPKSTVLRRRWQTCRVSFPAGRSRCTAFRASSARE